MYHRSPQPGPRPQKIKMRKPVQHVKVSGQDGFIWPLSYQDDYKL